MTELKIEELEVASFYWGTNIKIEDVSEIKTPIFITDDILLAQDMSIARLNDGTLIENGYVYKLDLEGVSIQRTDRRRSILLFFDSVRINETITTKRSEDGTGLRISRHKN
jgi:hypothetical protein